MPKTKKKSIYGVHPGVKMVADWIASLPEKTGKSLQEWVKVVKQSRATLDLALERHARLNGNTHH